MKGNKANENGLIQGRRSLIYSDSATAPDFVSTQSYRVPRVHPMNGYFSGTSIGGTLLRVKRHPQRMATELTGGNEQLKSRS